MEHHLYLWNGGVRLTLKSFSFMISMSFLLKIHVLLLHRFSVIYRYGDGFQHCGPYLFLPLAIDFIVTQSYVMWILNMYSLIINNRNKIFVCRYSDVQTSYLVERKFSVPSETSPSSQSEDEPRERLRLVFSDDEWVLTSSCFYCVKSESHSVWWKMNIDCVSNQF